MGFLALTTRTYVGIGINTQGCAVITVGSSQDNPGNYLISRDYFSKQITYKGIIDEVNEALKIREIPLDDLESEKQKAMSELDSSEQSIIRRENLINHFYSIVTFKDVKIEAELNGLSHQYKGQQSLIKIVSNPLFQIKNLIECTSGLINDGNVHYNTDLNIEDIKNEISTLIEPEDFNNLSPQLIALSLSLGEAEYRRLSYKEDYGYSVRNSAETALRISSNINKNASDSKSNLRFNWT